MMHIRYLMLFLFPETKTKTTKKHASTYIFAIPKSFDLGIVKIYVLLMGAADGIIHKLFAWFRSGNSDMED